MVVQERTAGGAGFDASWHDGLREAIRGLLRQPSGGRDAFFTWRELTDRLRAVGFRDAWRAVQYIESHDEVYQGRGLRTPALAVGGGDTRSWYATSRSRVALGLLMTAPGISMLFMGQEILEDKQWTDDPGAQVAGSLDWARLADEKQTSDFHRFTRELIWLRRRHPALRGENVAVLLADDVARVLMLHRWLEGIGRDVVIVASFNESNLHGFRIPLPGAERWFERLNSDVYEN